MPDEANQPVQEKECIEKNIPEEQAVEKLIELIKANGDTRKINCNLKQKSVFCTIKCNITE